MFTEQEVYDMLSLLFACVFLNIAPENGWMLRQGGKQVGDIINKLIEKSLNEVAPSTSVCFFFYRPSLVCAQQ